MGYTETEIRTTVEKLLLSAIRRPVNSLGARDTDTTFSDIQETAAGVYVLYYRASFYTVYLAAQRLLDEMKSAQADFDNLITALDVLRRHVLPVRDVSSLVNAKVALFELESAVSVAPPSDVTRVPAYVRFNQNINRFLLQATAIKSQGQIVPTPQEARGSIPALMSNYRSVVEQLVEKVNYLHVSIDNFTAVGLPKLVSSSVISKARKLVEERSNQMEQLDEVERLEVLRSTVLDLLGAKAAVTKFGSAPTPSAALAITGTASAFADGSRPATPAALSSSKYGPFITLSSVTASENTYKLSVWLNGNAPPAAADEIFYFPISFYARVEGGVAEPFNITSGINDSLVVDSNGTSVTIPITAGVGRTSDQICTDINVRFDVVYGAGLSPFIAEPYYAPIKFDGMVNVTAANTIEALKNVATPGGVVTVTGTFPIDPSTSQSYIQVGDKVTFHDSVNNGTFTVTGFLPSVADPQYMTVLPATLSVANSELIQSGPAARRIRLVPRDRKTSCQDKEYIQIKRPTNLAATTSMTFGYYGEVISKSRPSDASVLAAHINDHSQKVTASAVVDAQYSNIQLRTEPSSALRMVMFYCRGSCSYASGGPGSLLVTLDSLPSVDVPPLVGAVLVLRGGYEPGTLGTITAVGTAVGTLLPLTVNMGASVTGTAGVIVEIGPPTGIAEDMSIVVADGVNEGTYHIDKVTSVPFEVDLRDPIPQYRDGYNQPEFMRADVGYDRLVISSKNTTLSTKVLIRDDTLLLFSTVGPHSEIGSTPYLLLPSRPRELEVGNVLARYISSTSVPDFSEVIEKIYGDLVVQLSGELPVTFSGNFGNNLPFLRLRRDRSVDFDSFKSSLSAWLQQPDIASLDRYFLDLNRLVNPLLRNTNPQGTDVVAAANRVKDIYSLLLRTAASSYGADPEAALETFLSSYAVDTVAEVDALVRTFKERGSDRALSYLLQGRFSDFFGLDKEGVSYAGTFQKAMREVAREDLPVSKTDRYDQRTGPVISSSESPNYEYDTSDLDTAPSLDLPDM
jgi:hypothetical protein